MKSIQIFSARIWAVWGIIIFSLTLLVAIVPIWLSNYIREPRGTEVFRRVSKAWMIVFLHAVGCRITIKGKQYFKEGENYVVVSNHNSLMDVPLVTPFVPGPNKTIAKTSFARIPLFGLIYKRGSVLVDRNSEASRKDSYNKMKKVLQDGLHMCIYPEGTRNRTGNPLKPFHDGAFRLSIDTGKPIIPLLLFNTAKVLPADKGFYLWPAHLKMFFLPPVYPQGKTVAELREDLFRIMWDFISAHQEGKKPGRHLPK